MKSLGGLAVVVLTLLAPAYALAWNNQGHMAIGEIAYDELARSNPALVRKIVDSASALPRRTLLDAALKGVSGAQRDRLTFAYLARWPDDIRGTEHDRPDHHYRLRGVSALGALLPIRNGHADIEVANDLALLRNAATPQREKAVALAWLFHVEGDMHQPLHAGTWLSWTFPKSDRAGTIAFVRRAPGTGVDDLHNFWDGSPDRPGADVAGTDALRLDLERRLPRERLPELSARPNDFSAWADESATLARRIVYQDGTLTFSADRTRPTALTARYVAVARALADLRVATAGYRLADILAALP